MCEMKFLVEDDVRQLFARLCTGLAAALLAAECASWALCPALCLPLLGLFVLLAAGVLGSAAAYFARRQKRLEEAAAQVRALLDGDATARLDSGREGQLYRLFHEVNEMAAVLNAHADREQREKQFLKNTMADISHQLKTPLAALNIYNGLLQAGTDDAENVRELAELSEQELDRMEQLVQSLLKLTRLDAGTVQLEKTEQDLQGLLEQTARPFACRARQEQKHPRRGHRDGRGQPLCRLCAHPGGGHRHRHPPGGPAPSVQAILPQPLCAGYAGHRVGAAAGEIHCGGPRRHTGSGK